MRPPRFALLLILAAAIAGAGSVDAQPIRDAHAGRSRTDPRATTGRRQLEALLERINRRRVAIGCRALHWDDRLAAVAQRHSADMARRRFFGHTNPDGDDPFDRLRKSGIRYRNAAENLAAGQRTAEETYTSWMSSPGHRRNMENCVYTRAGLGLAQDCWTLVLTRPADSAR